MTTSNSPMSELRIQAERIAKMLKAAERGEYPATPFADKLREASSRPMVKFAVVMDDKVLSIRMAWSEIARHSEETLTQSILGHMREHREQAGTPEIEK